MQDLLNDGELLDLFHCVTVFRVLKLNKFSFYQWTLMKTSSSFLNISTCKEALLIGTSHLGSFYTKKMLFANSQEHLALFAQA